MPAEVITVSVGQCGNQIAWRFWDTLVREHAASSAPGTFDDAAATFFTNVDDDGVPVGGGRTPLGVAPRTSAPRLHRLRARAILVDTEEGVVSQLLRSPLGPLFDASQRVVDVSGAGNNWAHGYCEYGPRYRSALLEQVRMALEAADSPQAVLLLHSLGGGTGSGLGSYLLEAVRDDAPELFRISAAVVPSPECDDVVTGPYNAALALWKLADAADVVLPLENGALMAIAAAVDRAGCAGGGAPRFRVRPASTVTFLAPPPAAPHHLDVRPLAPAPRPLGAPAPSASRRGGGGSAGSRAPGARPTGSHGAPAVGGAAFRPPIGGAAGAGRADAPGGGRGGVVGRAISQAVRAGRVGDSAIAGNSARGGIGRDGGARPRPAVGDDDHGTSTGGASGCGGSAASSVAAALRAADAALDAARRGEPVMTVGEPDAVPPVYGGGDSGRRRGPGGVGGPSARHEGRPLPPSDAAPARRPRDVAVHATAAGARRAAGVTAIPVGGRVGGRPPAAAAHAPSRPAATIAGAELDRLRAAAAGTLGVLRSGGGGGSGVGSAAGAEAAAALRPYGPLGAAPATRGAPPATGDASVGRRGDADVFASDVGDDDWAHRSGGGTETDGGDGGRRRDRGTDDGEDDFGDDDADSDGGDGRLFSARDGGSSGGARGRVGTAWDGVNNIAALALAHLTSSMRFEGPHNVDLNELATTLVPFPRLHFLTAGLAPLFSKADDAPGGGARRVDALFADATSRSHQLVRGDPRASTLLAAAFLLRGGDVAASDAHRNVRRMRRDLKMTAWNTEGFKVGICSQPSLHQPAGPSLLALSNAASIADTLEAARARAARLFAVRAHVHHYTEFMEEDAFRAADEALADVVSAYDDGAGVAGDGI